jgi:hypothetical protein
MNQFDFTCRSYYLALSFNFCPTTQMLPDKNRRFYKKMANQPPLGPVGGTPLGRVAMGLAHNNGPAGRSATRN